MAYKDIVTRIGHALSVATEILQDFTPSAAEVEIKQGGEPPRGCRRVQLLRG